jgi:dCMP deaminase
MLINAGIRRVVYAGDYPDKYSRLFLEEAGVALVRVNRPHKADTVYTGADEPTE